MKQEILKRLSAITKEEQAILDGENAIDRTIYMNDGKDEINAKKLIDSGNLITMRPHTRFVRFPEHTHDYVEIVYMCSGQTTHIINGRTVLLTQGDTLILNQHSTQAILPAGETDVAVNFIVMPSFFEKIPEFFGEEETPIRRFIIDCIAGRESTDGYLHFNTASVVQIQNLFENLILSFYENENKIKTTELTMSLILLELIDHADRLDSESIDGGILIKALGYIENNYQSATLSDLAKSLHYDLYWLSREIKRRAKKTFTQLLQEKRLAQAEYLLINTNMKITDISTCIGYNNTNYFFRIFEERYRTTPKKFRDSIKEKRP